jgi:hypothetical protein
VVFDRPADDEGAVVRYSPVQRPRRIMRNQCYDI